MQRKASDRTHTNIIIKYNIILCHYIFHGICNAKRENDTNAIVKYKIRESVFFFDNVNNDRGSSSGCHQCPKEWFLCIYFIGTIKSKAFISFVNIICLGTLIFIYSGSIYIYILWYSLKCIKWFNSIANSCSWL